MPILTIQQRLHEIGRIRLGHKGPKGEPKKLTTFRLTSLDKRAIEVAAQTYGGTVKQCTEKDLPGQWEVISEVSQLPFYVSPTAPTQYMEMWSGGGCQRRCDSQTELLSGKPCMCCPEDKEQCKPTTRLSVILPDLPGLGCWRLESHGWTAATELLQSFEFLKALAGSGVMTEGILALEEKISRKDGLTRRFMIPVIRLGLTPRELLATRELPSGADALPTPSNELPARQEPQDIKNPNPRGMAFAIMHEMGLPAHDGEAKLMYYDVIGKYLGKKGKLDTLSALTDEEWSRVAQWMRNVQQGKLTMPAPFAEWLAKQVVPAEDEYDPFSDTEETAELPGVGA